MGMSLRHFGIWLALAVVAFGIAHGKHNYVIFAGFIVVSGVIYVLDCLRQPSRPCWRCRGEGNVRSGIWRYATGPCPACGRSGRQRRLGSVIFGIPLR